MIKQLAIDMLVEITSNIYYSYSNGIIACSDISTLRGQLFYSDVMFNEDETIAAIGVYKPQDINSGVVFIFHYENKRWNISAALTSIVFNYQGQKLEFRGVDSNLTLIVHPNGLDNNRYIFHVMNSSWQFKEVFHNDYWIPQ